MSATLPADVSTHHRSFIWQRLGSLLAFAPLGVWTAGHVWNNLAAFRGAQAWEQAVTHHDHPVAQAITMALVLGPLVLHTIWGLGRLFITRPNNVRYGYYTNLKYLLQRLSAIGVMLFVSAHLWLAMIQPRFVQGHAEHFADIAHEMRHHGPTLAVYLLGTLGVAYHLGNGLGTLAMALGLITTPGAQRRVEYLSVGSFLVLLAMSWTAIYGLWRAGG